MGNERSLSLHVFSSLNTVTMLLVRRTSSSINVTSFPLISLFFTKVSREGRGRWGMWTYLLSTERGSGGRVTPGFGNERLASHLFSTSLLLFFILSHKSHVFQMLPFCSCWFPHCNPDDWTRELPTPSAHLPTPSLSESMDFSGCRHQLWVVSLPIDESYISQLTGWATSALLAANVQAKTSHII